jgi:hypothetical protein
MATVALGTVIAAAPAEAPGASDHLNELFSGPFVGIGIVDSDPDCRFIHVTQPYTYGAGRPPPASGTVDVEVCVDTRTFPFSVTGSFIFTSRTGATLFGTLVGTADPGVGFENTYAVTGGTRQFRRVRGTIEATAVVDLSVVPQTISGTYTASLRRG